MTQGSFNPPLKKSHPGAEGAGDRPPRGTVFLDRDGVLNRDLFPCVRRVEDYEFLPGAKDAVARLTKEGFRIFIATNKSVMGFRLLSREAHERITAHMLREVQASGGRIEKVYHCPHTPFRRCRCHKPRPGMLEAAARQYGVDPETSWMVGDNVKDVRAGSAFGARTIALTTTHGRGALERKLKRAGAWPDFFAADLGEAVDVMLREQGGV